MLMRHSKEVRADATVPLAYDDARDFCRRSHWLVYLPSAIATVLLYCTLYAGIVHVSNWAPRHVRATPGTHFLPILMDPAIVDWAVPWFALAVLLVLEWVGLKLMPLLTALAVDLVAARNIPRAERQREVVLCLYTQFPGQAILSLFAVVPASVLVALFLSQPGEHRVAPGYYVILVVAGIGLGILLLCAKSRHHLGSDSKAALCFVSIVLLTTSMIVYGMLGLRMVVAAIWSSLL